MRFANNPNEPKSCSQFLISQCREQRLMLLNSSSNRKLRSSRRPEHLYREKVKRVGWVRFATHETCLYDTNKFYQVSHLPMFAFDLKQSRQVSSASTPWHVQASMKISI